MFLRVAQVLYNDAEVCEEDAFFAWQDDTAEEVSSKQITHAQRVLRLAADTALPLRRMRLGR